MMMLMAMAMVYTRPEKTKAINENVLKCGVYAGVTVLFNELKRIDPTTATTKDSKIYTRK